MSDQAWAEAEENYQRKINETKISYTPITTVSVTILQGRNISVGLLHDLVDVPDPQVYVQCDEAISKKHFKTQIARDQTNPVWNETFTFVLSNEETQAKIKIDLYEEDQFKYDPHLGSAVVETDSLELDKPKTLTFDFKQHGQLDVELVKRYRTSPDFRHSLGLSEEEIQYRIARKPKTRTALHKFLKLGKEQMTLDETPTIAMAISGGGYRAVATSCGAMEALAENNLIDALMYIAGLSGSSWYISSSYMYQSLANYKTLIEHHDWLRKQMESSLLSYAWDISFYKRFKKYRDFKIENHQPTTIVDFYGLALGETFLNKEDITAPISSLKNYAKSPHVPFPIMSCALVRENMPMSAFWDEIEMNAFEVSLPGYGINIPAEKFNSRFGHGVLLNDLPEPPLHYIMGASGSAFAIMSHKIKDKNEIDDDLWKYIENHQENSKKGTAENIYSSSDSDSEATETQAMSEDKKNFASCSDDNWFDQLRSKESDENGNISKPENFGSRGFILHRTARVRNCAAGFSDLPKFRLNNKPISQSSPKRTQKKISFKQARVSLCDAALGCNLPSIYLMRPQRKVDILIVIDCSNYLNEQTLKMEMFATVQNQVQEHGIKFPRICLAQLSKHPFREMYIFEDEKDPECPIVIWFTLANAKFKKQKDPYRRPGYPTPDTTDPGREKFNDFCIFPESSEFGTLKTSFTPLNFDRIRELMRFNVMSNMWVVKKKIALKRQQLKRLKKNENVDSKA